MSDEQAFFLSQAAITEFESQDVFATLEEFVEAMPPATRGVHLIPVELVMQAQEAEAQSAEASDADQFGWLTWMHTTPDREDPTIEDESIFRVDDANDLLKQQEGEFLRSPGAPDDMRDEGLQDVKMTELPYDYQSLPEHTRMHTQPGDFDDYSQNNYFRKFELEENQDRMSQLYAIYSAEHRPIVMPLDVFRLYEVRPVTPRKGADGLVASLRPGRRTAWTAVRISTRWNEIVKELNPSVMTNAKSCKVKLIRADPKNRRWTFDVHSTSGSGRTHKVHLKAERKGTATNMTKVDLKLGCSCEFWKWQGPDHHAAAGDYLDRKKRSDGSTPNVRDPDGINRVCKHVYAASALFLKYRLPKAKKSSVTDQAVAILPDKGSFLIQRASPWIPLMDDFTIAQTVDQLADKIYKQTG